MKQAILTQFDIRQPIFERFQGKLKSILEELLVAEHVKFLQVTCRVKEKESLSKKIDDKLNKYNNLEEITDVLGARIVTYFESDVDQVAKIIEREFKIDRENSVDKRKLKVNEFGYRSLHYVLSLDEKRGTVTENKAFATYKAEVQIRSILQHAWAEIQHGLGYKDKAGIPEKYVRAFNRTAALLETADIEFDRLKTNLSEYSVGVRQLIEETPSQVDLNNISLMVLTYTHPVTLECLELLKLLTNCEIVKDADYTMITGRFYGLFKVDTIKELQDELNEHRAAFIDFVDEYVRTEPEAYRNEKLPSSTVLFYYQHFLAAISENPEFIEKYFDFGSQKISKKGKSPEQFIEIYRKSQAS